jgi:hypothetical protein
MTIPRPPKGKYEFDFRQASSVRPRLTAREINGRYQLIEVPLDEDAKVLAESNSWEEIYRLGTARKKNVP